MKRLLFLFVPLLSFIGFSRLNEKMDYVIYVKPYVSTTGDIIKFVDKETIKPEVVIGAEVIVKPTPKESLLVNSKKDRIKWGYYGGLGLRQLVTIIDTTPKLLLSTNLYALIGGNYNFTDSLGAYGTLRVGLGMENLINLQYAGANSNVGVPYFTNLEIGLNYRNFTFGAIVEGFDVYKNHGHYPRFKFGLNIGYDIEVARF